MAKGKETAAQPTDSKGLKDAVDKAVGEAQDNAETGNVATVKETSAQPAESLPTGQHSHQS